MKRQAKGFLRERDAWIDSWQALAGTLGEQQMPKNPSHTDIQTHKDIINTICVLPYKWEFFSSFVQCRDELLMSENTIKLWKGALLTPENKWLLYGSYFSGCVFHDSPANNTMNHRKLALNVDLPTFYDKTTECRCGEKQPVSRGRW